MKFEHVKRFLGYLSALVVVCILLLYALIVFAKVTVAYMFNGKYEQLTGPFLWSCTIACLGIVFLAIIYTVQRFIMKTKNDSYPIINFKTGDGIEGYIYTSTNGEVVFETNMVVFEISSAEGFEIWNGSQYVDANLQDLNVTKDKKVYARLKRNNDLGGATYSAQSSISSDS